ncbi:hypothetical protein F4861DRAFT_521140 [Xylaria intraflava]|nr:hypothetical protein F4861DRAFT_521140 [Xylaria intraflava]
MNPNTRTPAELRQLVFGDNAFTKRELRYIKYLLSDLYIDLIGELPVELVAMIAMHLRPTDFAHCLRVSRVWRQVFLSGPVMGAYARQMWPALIRDVVNPSNFLGNLSRLGWAFYGFQRPAEKAHTELVRWDNKSHYELDPGYHSRPDTLPDAYVQYQRGSDTIARCSARYAFGKVAWQVSVSMAAIAVDDLRLKTRKIFTPPSGIMHGSRLELRALGSRLVIATIDRLLIAWDHFDNHAHEKWLPCRSRLCSTQDNNVAVVLEDGHVLLWSPGHEIVQLNTSHLMPKPAAYPSTAETWSSRLDVFFDQRNDKTSYLASGCFSSADSSRIDSNDMFRLAVHEFLSTDHVASWYATYRYPSRLWAGCVVSGFDLKPPKNISIIEYQHTHDCIIFRLTLPEGSFETIAVFDKTKRKFIQLGQDFSGGWRQLPDGTYALSNAGDFPTPYEPHWFRRFDLDFMVDFKEAHEGYAVAQSRFIHNNSDDDIMHDTH